MSTPKLLQLPAEIHRLIIEHLPLSASILYQTQVCSTLRSQFEGRLKFPHPHRFYLVDWTIAEREVRDILRRQDEDKLEAAEVDERWTLGKKKATIWDTSPSSTPRPAPARSVPLDAPHPSLLLLAGSLSALRTGQGRQLDQDGTDALVGGNSPEVAFFIRCIRLLGRMGTGRPASGCDPFSHTPSRLTVLSLLSRSGFKVEQLIRLLDTQPSLQHVETILMTTASSIDAGECRLMLMILMMMMMRGCGKHKKKKKKKI
jgi:hypothetical protein